MRFGWLNGPIICLKNWRFGFSSVADFCSLRSHSKVRDHVGLLRAAEKFVLCDRQFGSMITKVCGFGYRDRRDKVAIAKKDLERS